MSEPGTTRLCTPQECFAILADWHRCIEQIDPLNMYAARPIVADMSIRAWACASGPCFWDVMTGYDHRRVGPWFEDVLGISMTRDEWCIALRDPRRRTILDLCGDIAPRVRLPHLEEIEILGSRCLAASVFRHFQFHSRTNGEYQRFGPSTPLSELDGGVLSSMSVECAKLAPGVMPLETTRWEHETPLVSLFQYSSLLFGVLALAAFVGLPQYFGVLSSISIGAGLWSCAVAAFKATRRLGGEIRREYDGYGSVAEVCRSVAAQHARVSA